MGFLAPLYVLGALAVVGPIVLHLIRRQPQGEQQFSSLMFLSPSPPRLTRRSRLDNLLLLLLRSLAIILIAFAFARPYLRQERFLSTNLEGRMIVVLFDTSASMQRPGVWESAISEANALLDSLSANDRVALYTIDDRLQSLVAVEGEVTTEPKTTQAAARDALRGLQPSWRRTELAMGLTSLADLLAAAAISGDVAAGKEKEIVLISDLHQESGLEALQGYPWPDSIRLDPRPVQAALPGNARASLMQAEEESDDAVQRLRIENNHSSPDQSLAIAWANSDQTFPGSRMALQVPPGQVRVIPLPQRPAGADRVLLSGDNWDADNAVFVPQPKPIVERIAFVGEESPAPEDDLFYFLQRAPLDTELYRRELERISSGSLPAFVADDASLAVFLQDVESVSEIAAELRAFVRRGGIVAVCLADPLSESAATEDFVKSLFDVQGVGITESAEDDFALLAKIDYQHPVFKSFADPRFNDFSKLRFWSHRVVQLPESARLATVASFDDGSPMLLHQELERGHLWLLTAGWQPNASGLGLSSKFVPILMRILDPAGRSQAALLTYEVGEQVDVHQLESISVLDEKGQPVDESVAVLQGDTFQAFEPGLYRLQGEGDQRQLAIQIPATESRLEPLDTSIFEQYGVSLGKVASDAQRSESARQLKVQELEGRQRLWQWLIVAAIMVLLLETVIAGWMARQANRRPAPA